MDVVAPTPNLLVLQQRARVDIARGDCGRGAQTRNGHGHVARAAGHAELAVVVVSPADDTAIAHDGARVFIARGNDDGPGVETGDVDGQVALQDRRAAAELIDRVVPPTL